MWRTYLSPGLLNELHICFTTCNFYCITQFNGFSFILILLLNKINCEVWANVHFLTMPYPFACEACKLIVERDVFNDPNQCYIGNSWDGKMALELLLHLLL